MTVYGEHDNIIENSGVTYLELGLTTEEDFHDLVDRLILRASRLIDRYCGVDDSFFFGGAIVTQIVDGNEEDTEDVYDGTHRQSSKTYENRVYILDYTPVIGMTGVYENTAAIGEAEVWVELLSYSYNATSGRLVFSANDYPSEGVDNVKFVYTAGYASCPSEVTMACEELVQNGIMKMNKNQLNAKVRFGAASPIETQPTISITADIKQMLDPYKRKNL